MKFIIISVYFLTLLIIAIYASKRNKTAKEFALGGRSFNAVTTALGAGAADMSGWLLMALPGVVYLNGISEIWYPLGLSIGAYLNWKLIATKLRISTEKYGNALTITSFLGNKFRNNQMGIRLTVVSITTTFFMVYITSALVALAFLVQTFTNLSYHQALILSTIFVFLYTSIGGFTAINWIDVLQGSLMLFALLIIPITIFYDAPSISHIKQAFIANHVNYDDVFKDLNIITIISLMSWGLGYFGQPHILVRFMATKTPSNIKTSSRICMSWMILSLIGAFLVGLFGKIIFTEGTIDNPETIFLRLSDKLFHPVIAGICLAAVLSAVMSTISAQLHASASSITEEAIRTLKSNPSKLYLPRAIMLFLITISLIQAFKPNNSILGLVSLAWAGLGASFGPVIIYSLYAKNPNGFFAISSIIAGAVTVLIWGELHRFGGIFEIYEIIPGFLVASSILVSQILIQKLKRF